MARWQEDDDFRRGVDGAFEITISQLEELELMVAQVERDNEERTEAENDGEQVNMKAVKEEETVIPKQEKEDGGLFAGESPTVEMQLVAAESQALGEIKEDLEDAADVFGNLMASQEEDIARIVEEDAEKRREEKKIKESWICSLGNRRP